MQEDDSRPVTIYALVEPITGAVRYIGQTRRTLEWRLALHMSARTGKARAAWIDGLRAQGLRPLIVGLEVTDQKGADEAEARHIAEHRARGCALTNAQSAPRRRRTDGTRKRGRPKTANGLTWRTVVRLPLEMGQTIEQWAKEEGITVGELLRRIVVDGIERARLRDVERALAPLRRQEEKIMAELADLHVRRERLEEAMNANRQAQQALSAEAQAAAARQAGVEEQRP